MDLEKVRAGAEEYNQQQIATQEAIEAENRKTIWDKALEKGEDVYETVSETAGEVVDFAGNTFNDMVDAYNKAGQAREEFLHRGAEMQKKLQEGTFSEEDVNALRQSGREASVSLTNMAVSPVRQAARSFVKAYAEDNDSALQPFAESIQKSDVNQEYFMTSDEKLQQARHIEAELGIPAESFVGDNEAFKTVMDVYNYKKKVQDLDKVWEEYPEIQEIAKLDPQAAAIALHNREVVGKTHGIIESFTHFLEKGNMKLEYDNIQYKIMKGEASENDIKRAENLKQMMDADKKQAPSFLDDPAAAMAGAVAQSLPEMAQGLSQGIKDTLPVAALAVAATIATGGTDLLALGAAAGTAALREAIIKAMGTQGVKTAASWAFRYGMWEGMYRPEAGARFAEYGEMKDKQGNPLLTDDERRLWAALGGGANAGIEMLDFGLAMKALKPTPHAAKVFDDIIKNTAAKKSEREMITDMVKGRAADWLKLTTAESGEEALQSVSDDLIHNAQISGKDTNEKTYEAKEIGSRAFASFVESLPGSMGFATVGAGGGMATRTGAMVRNFQREARVARQYGENAVHTMNGTIMVEQLQQAVASGKLKETAPDVQQKILREQLKDTGYETAYIDVETALQKETGVEDLRKVADKAGMSQEDLQTAIDEKGFIPVPVEVLAQAESTPDLLDSVSFKENAESMARMRMNQKELRESYQAALKQVMDNKFKNIDNIIAQAIPNATKEQKEMLEEIIMTNLDNPAQGFKAVRAATQQELDEILAPAIKALEAGAGKAHPITIKDEQGNDKTIYTPGENEPWYRNFYNQFNHYPTKAEFRDMAIALVTGDPSAPKVMNWTVDSLEQQQAMENNKGLIDRLQARLKTLQEIKPQVEKLTGVEMQLTEGLTPEGFSMYRQIFDWLKNVGGATARQARMGAILAARHADIYAAKVTERTGKKYTALDYMHDKIGFSVRRADAGLNQVEAGKIRLYHGSPNNMQSIKIGKPGPMENVFWGMFFNDESDSARAHAENIYYIDIDEDKIADAKDFAYDDDAYNAIKESFGEPLEDEELFHDLIAGRQTMWDVSEDITAEERDKLNKVFGDVLGRRPGTEDYELDWAFQSAAGYIADKLGYEAVWVEDEHGASVIVTPGHEAVKASDGEILNQMAGINARNINAQQLQRAKAMLAQGKNMDAIFKETGWLQGADGKWRFEIPDNLDKISWKGIGTNASLWQVYDNERLYDAYPWLASVSVKLVDLAEGHNGRVTGGVYRLIEINKNISDKEKSSALVHEIQHMIQEKEGFASGGSMNQVRGQIERQKKILARQLSDIPQGKEYVETNNDLLTALFNGNDVEALMEKMNEINDSLPEKARDQIDKISSLLARLEGADEIKDDYNLYHNLGGEQEARETQSRAGQHTKIARAREKALESERKLQEEVKKLSPNMLEKYKEFQQLDIAFEENRGLDKAEEERYFQLRDKVLPKKLLDAFDRADWDAFDYEEEAGTLKMPVPHDENAIIVFDGQEMAMSQALKTREETLFQRAWHGSPYDFETFDLGAIGTGEGNQVHGWGLYFAGNREVSKHYQDLLSGNYQTIIIGRTKYKPDDYFNLISKKGKNIRDLGKEYVIASKSLLIEKDNDKSIKILNAIDEEGEMLYGEWITKEDGIKAAELLQKGKVKTEKAGKLFEVEIPDNDVLLDEQKKFNEQPKKVQESLRRLINESETASKHKAWAEQIYESDGKKIYGIVAGIAEGDVPKGTNVNSINKLGSELLNKYGIRGITYEGGQDGRCYVVFDDKAIDVIEKYNQEVRKQQIKGQTQLQANGKRIVSILEAADESTFMHEMAHVFLYDLEDLARIDDVSAKELEIVNEWAEWKKGAAEEYRGTGWYSGDNGFKAIEDTIINAEAAGDYDTAEKYKRIWRHERFARGFELYLKDGQAPAKGLKAVFRMFKQFLRKIYAAFASDGGKPSLPVKRVMDRMIATEQEIEAMELDDRFADVEKAGGEKLLDEKEEDTYRRFYQESEDEAKEQLLKIVMKDLEKEKQAEFDYEVAAERARKEKELQQEPIYMAEKAAMTSGSDSIVENWYPSVEAFREELANTPPLEEALQAHMDKFTSELDARLIESHLSEEAVEKAMKKSKYRTKMETLKGKAMAKKLALIKKINAKAEKAMESIEEKLTALPEDTDLKVDKDTAGVKSIMKEISKLKFAAKWNKDELAHIESMIRASTQDEVRQAIKQLKENNARDKIREEEILKATEGRQAIFRDMAKAAMAGKPISESCNVGYYRSQEKKAARRVRDMLRAKRYDMALKAQEQQANFAALAELAEANKEERDKLLAQVNRELNARTVKLPKDERYWHRQLAYILRISKNEPNIPENGVRPLHELIKGMEDSLDVLQGALDEMINIASQGERYQGYQSMTMDEFKDAVQSLHTIYVVGRDKFKMKTLQGKNLLDVVDEITTEEDTVASNIEVDRRMINEDKGGLAYSELIGNTGDKGHLIAKRGQDYIASNLKPENILSMIGKKAHDYIYGTLERAAEAEAKMQAGNIQKLQEIMSVYSHKERQDWSKKIYDFSTEKGDKISKEQIMCMALNWGNLSNRQRLLGGLASDERTPEAVAARTKEVMDLFQKTMTAKDWQVIQKLWDHIGSFWEDTVRVEEKLNGITLERIEPSPFTITSSDGQEMTLAGGYVPVKYDTEKSSRAGEQAENAEIQSMLAGAQRFGAGRSFTKGRSEFDIFRPLQLDFGVIEEHLQNVIHNATYRLPVRDVYRLVTNLDFENHVVEHLGREYHNVLKAWAVDAWKPPMLDNNTADNVLSKGLGMLRRSATLSIMGYRLWPVIENASNIAVAAEKIGSAEMAAAMGDFYSDPVGNLKSVKQKSLFMRNRIDNMDRDIRSQPGIFHAGNKLAEFAVAHAYDMMVYSDLACSAPLWMRVYKNSYEPAIKEVKAENEKNIQYLIECQQKVDDIKARIVDLTTEAGQMEEHLKARRYASPETADMLRQSPFALHTDENLRALAGENRKQAKALEKERWQAEAAFQEAQEIKILTDDEILDEAETRAVFKADAAIRDTFGSGRNIDLPAVQRSRNEITKLLTVFYGFFNTQFNAVFMEYARSSHLPANSAIAKWMPFARTIMFRFVLTALIGSLLQFGLGLAGGSDDEKKRKVKGPDGKTTEVDVPVLERFMKVFGKNVISTSVGSMYLVRDVVGVISDFVISDKTYGLNSGSVASRGVSELGKMVVLLSKKGQRDADIQAQQEKREKTHQEKLAKYKGKKRQEYLKKWEEDQQYVKPPKRITYAEIAGHGLKGISSMTAANTGITSTMVNAVTTTMQYMLDDDMRYDASWKNIIWSALFDKKPVEREIPKKPPAEPKKKKKKKN